MEKLVRSLAISVVLFFVVLGFVIGSRMDQTTIALLGGTTIGLLIAAPCAAIVTYLIVCNRNESHHQFENRFIPPNAQNSSPQYWVVPQALSNVPQLMSQPPMAVTPATPPAFELPPRRKFYMIGASGEPSEISPDAEPVIDAQNAGGLS